MMDRRLKLPALALALALAVTCGTGALAAAQPGAGSGLQTPDYRIQTDETHWNFNTGEFTMPHRVRFSRPGTDAVANSATGNSKQGTATLTGDVVVHDSGNATEAGDAAYHGSGPATLACDQLQVDSRSRVYTATGHVHFSQGTRSGTADRAILNRANGTLHLEGNVHLSENGSTLSAESVDYNLNTRDVDFRGNPAVMTQPVNQAGGGAAAPGAPKAKTTPKPAAKPQPKPTRKP